MQAVLEPGDVILFPGFWAHWTESMDLSCSMTYRFNQRGEKVKLHKTGPAWLCGLL